MKSYSKAETVIARLNGEYGIVVDCEDDVQIGWLYQVRFCDGSCKWFKSCELRKA